MCKLRLREQGSGGARVIQEVGSGIPNPGLLQEVMSFPNHVRVMGRVRRCKMIVLFANLLPKPLVNLNHSTKVLLLKDFTSVILEIKINGSNI